MSEFASFFQLGFSHIVSSGALDHILFLLVLAVVYRWQDWRDALWVVSAFTVGHSITLGLAVTDRIAVNEKVVEFLIPLTIVITAMENIAMRDRLRSTTRRRYRPLLAGMFGLVHGAGFAGYLKSLFMSDIALPLLGFNVGIEAGQLAVLTAIAIALVFVDMGLGRTTRNSRMAHSFNPVRLRVLVVSSLIVCVAGAWTVERRPW